MNIIQHPSNNDVLGAPPGVAIDDCRALPITRVLFPNDVPAVWSYWQPTAEERAAIAAGAPVRLSVWGTTHAPVHVGVDGLEYQAVTFQIRHDGRTFTVRTVVGDNQLTRVQFLEDEPRPPPAPPMETNGDNDE